MYTLKDKQKKLFYILELEISNLFTTNRQKTYKEECSDFFPTIQWMQAPVRQISFSTARLLGSPEEIISHSSEVTQTGWVWPWRAAVQRCLGRKPRSVHFCPANQIVSAQSGMWHLQRGHSFAQAQRRSMSFLPHIPSQSCWLLGEMGQLNIKPSWG